MGGSASQFSNANFLGQEVVDLKEIEYRDPRRRNSLAYNIASYVRFDREQGTYEEILNEIRTERNQVVYKIRAATAKYNAIAEAVLHVVVSTYTVGLFDVCDLGKHERSQRSDTAKLSHH